MNHQQPKRVLITLVALFVALSPLFGQDEASEDDIFADGAFDQTVTASQASAETTKLTWLGGVSVLSDTSLLLPSDRETYGARSLVSGKGFLKADKPDTGQFFVSYSFGHTWLTSTNDSVFKTVFQLAEPSLDTPQFQLSEVYLSFDVNKVLFVRLGNQLVNWGAAFFWSPADFINQRPADSQAAIDTRTGKPGLRLHLPVGVGNVFLFADLSQSLDASGVPQDLMEKGSVAARVDTTLLGFNLGVQGSYGKSSKPQAGATFSGNVLGFDLWGEYGATLPVNDYTYSWAASLGGEKSVGDFTLRFEGFENPDGKADTELTGQVLAKFTPFRWGQQYVFASLSKTKLLTDAIDGSVSTIANLSDLSYTATASLSVHLPKTLPFSLSVGYNGGPTNREFTLRTPPGSFTLSLKSVLEL
jgi:hypothetical protein